LRNKINRQKIEKGEEGVQGGEEKVEGETDLF
jgi:hypothetical protein